MTPLPMRTIKQKPNHQTITKPTREYGFTLIEVMVALAILAVVAIAASRASRAYLHSVDILQTQTLAHFVAQNTAAELRIQETWPINNGTQTIHAQGRDWQVTTTTQAALRAGLENITITVAPIIEGQPHSSVTEIEIMLSAPQQAIKRTNIDTANVNNAATIGGKP